MKKTPNSTSRQGFTLIELLIVVLIIAILAAIAVPNFLEFQTRAKVSRAKSDLRSIVIALEAYYMDNNEYPDLLLYRPPVWWEQNRGYISAATQLSSPIAYLSTTDFPDPFLSPNTNDTNQPYQDDSYQYVNIELYRQKEQTSLPKPAIKYVLVSYGPDQARGDVIAPNGSVDNRLSAYGDYEPSENHWFIASEYDPSNGTVSGGDILRFHNISR